MPERVECASCHTERAASIVDVLPEEREPCPVCGSTSLSHVVTLTEAVTVEEALSVAVGTTNTAATRRRQLEHATRALKAGVDTNTIGAAQEALKRALEALHELNDAMTKRGEWDQSGWSQSEVELWHGHIGARNAAHHGDSALAVLHASAPNRDQRYVWDLSPTAIGALHSKKQQLAYSARLARQPVLPALQRIVTLVVSSVGT